ncbi:hypothetical protein DRZ77_03490 [Candidatus Woesearchaeota archaeon]|nr:MAG: hypothetical protein DRZ77_03490 [Candidatus Woesearchaeota archaeon]
MLLLLYILWILDVFSSIKEKGKLTIKNLIFTICGWPVITVYVRALASIIILYMIGQLAPAVWNDYVARLLLAPIFIVYISQPIINDLRLKKLERGGLSGR